MKAVTLENGRKKLRSVVQEAPQDGQLYARKDGQWEPVTSINNIGVAGTMGFGVGVCPPRLLPADIQPLPQANIVGSETYGNYIHLPSSSIMCWVPAYWYRWGHPDSPHYAEYGNNAVDILPLSAFPSRSAAALQGYALDRAAIDDGVIQPGYFTDKYLVSNLNGIAASVRHGNPLSSHADHNPFAGLAGAPANNYSGIIAAIKTRGDDFFSAGLFVFTSLRNISIAHAQAAKSAAVCAWYDSSGVMNFPKGCNNDALRDTNDTSVLYTSDGYLNCGKTGSGVPFGKTTHNGQACGVADLSGPMWHIALGMTTLNSKYYVLAEHARMASLTAGNTVATDAWGAAGVAANYVEVGATWGDLRATNAQRVIGHPTNRVFSNATDGIDWQMAGCGVPLSSGAGGSNLFGNDGFWDYRPADMCPIACGHWHNAGHAGPGARAFLYVRSHSHHNVGGRAALYVVTSHDSDWQEES